MSKALILNDISRFLASTTHFMDQEAKREFMNTLFFADKQDFFFGELPTYRDETKKEVEKLAEETRVPVTTDYASDEIDTPSIAYHRIKGTIMAESRWWFSTKQFRNDMLEAESNPMIMAHFVHVNSGGGDAWYLDVAAAAMRDLNKPVVCYIERRAASAGLYLIVYGDVIYAATPNETIGSIGTMVAFMDIIPAYEKMGAKWIEEYATKSKLKNKKFNDLTDGKPEKYIKDELDPLQAQFEATVRDARKATADYAEDHDLFAGETYSTQASIELGLIDKQGLIEEALNDCYMRGQKYMQKIQKRNNAIHLLNN